MKYNVGSTDRVLRLVAGIGIAIGGVIFESYWGLIGVVLIAAAVFQFLSFLHPVRYEYRQERIGFASIYKYKKEVHSSLLFCFCLFT